MRRTLISLMLTMAVAAMAYGQEVAAPPEAKKLVYKRLSLTKLSCRRLVLAYGPEWSSAASPTGGLLGTQKIKRLVLPPDAPRFLMPEGIESMIAFDPLNALIVRGTEDAIEWFRRIIEALDANPPEALLNAKVEEVDVKIVEMKLVNLKAKELARAFATRTIVKPSEVFFVSNPVDTNSLHIQATDEGFERLKKLIAVLEGLFKETTS